MAILLRRSSWVGGFALWLALGGTWQAGHTFAQPPADQPVVPDATAPAKTVPAKPEPPGKVEVQPAARDDEIRQRLLDILKATGWYSDPEVTVKEGIVFLHGRTVEERYREWAGDLARNTEGVVVVVNQMGVAPSDIWDFSPALAELESMGRGFVRAAPLIVVALIILVLAWVAALGTTRLLRWLQAPRVRSRLLREVVARACGILVFLLGLYLILRFSGLTRLALSVLGGTGLVGLVLGIAFRDITENFLASLFLSLQQPFREGDLIEIAGITGYVQRLNSRTTVLMTVDGNQVQVPNSVVFKNPLRNFTSSPNRRVEFDVGIGYSDPIVKAQEAALKVLAEHPAVLKDPEPLVLVDSLGSATVNLRVYFWIDGSQHGLLKVKSAVIRLVKRAFQTEGISLPDEAREVIFPEGIPVRMLDSALNGAAARPAPPPPRADSEANAVSTKAEAGLQSEAKEIEEQARQAWAPDQGENLLADAAPKKPAAEGAATKGGEGRSSK